MSLLSPSQSLPWNVHASGNDIIVTNARATCFGGASDPQDNGDTASGISTKQFANFAAVSLPMDGLQFATKSRAFHAALDGSPLPKVPFFSLVVIESILGDKCERFTLPVIDLGPALHTGNALDLTVAAARLYKPNATATNFELVNVTFRILNAARFLH